MAVKLTEENLTNQSGLVGQSGSGSSKRSCSLFSLIDVYLQSTNSDHCDGPVPREDHRASVRLPQICDVRGSGEGEGGGSDLGRPVS
eukprot:760357-Hanusia_phi.AAC.4